MENVKLKEVLTTAWALGYIFTFVKTSLTRKDVENDDPFQDHYEYYKTKSSKQGTNNRLRLIGLVAKNLTAPEAGLVKPF